MASYSLPYIVDEQTLPAPLPTANEIASSSDILSKTGGCTVVGVGTHFVVKYGPQVVPLEGETMLFLSQSTPVPVPRVYAMYQDLDKKVTYTYIVMERIRGRTLAEEWPSMDSASKIAVSVRLRTILNDMRALPSPGRYCSVGRQRLPDGIFWTSDPLMPYAGPFNTEDELNKSILAKYVAEQPSKHKANYYARTFPEVFRDHEPTFSHADLQRKNIVMRYPSTDGDTDSGGTSAEPEPVIIDWEFAGWYPSYWEYARALFACGRWDDDWNEWVDEFLEPFRNEYAWTSMLLLEMWPC